MTRGDRLLVNQDIDITGICDHCPLQDWLERPFGEGLI